MVPDSWHSYPSIFALGHRAVEDILTTAVVVEEKVDGSQFSFCLTDEGDLLVRSKGCVMLADAPERMFTKAVESVKERRTVLHPGWTYRAEYLAKPKHNTLAYDRVPTGHLMIFDVNTGHEHYLTPYDRNAEAERLCLESIPVLHAGMIETAEQVRTFLDRTSVLGGQKVEGVVIKPVGYGMFGPDKKCLMAKFVSEAFKETHAHVWRENNPLSGDILERLAKAFTTEARWSKAVQHMRERGEITDSPQDIGKLIPEIVADTEKECAEEIREQLWRWAWPHLKRAVTRGAPEWYKDQLLRQQFKEEPHGQ